MRLVHSELARWVAHFDEPRGGRGERRGLWLTLVADDGSVGQGEAAPLPGYSPDDEVAAERALEEVHRRLGPLVGDRAVEAVARATEPLEERLRASPAARFALETALLDLWARRRGLSIAETLGGPRSYSSVPVNGLLVASPDAADLGRRARAIVDRGIVAIKVKLCASDDATFELELGALAALRRELPAPFELRLDANGAYTPDEARGRLSRLAALAPSFVEQPVARGSLEHLGVCAVPWAADESLQDEDEAARLLSASGCAAFIVKPAVLGFLRAYRLALRALDRGLGVVVTHLFDGPVGVAAACELALALPAPPLACGLDPHSGLAAWAPGTVPQLARSGLVIASGGVGLGFKAPLLR